MAQLLLIILLFRGISSMLRFLIILIAAASFNVNASIILFDNFLGGKLELNYDSGAEVDGTLHASELLFVELIQPSGIERWSSELNDSLEFSITDVGDITGFTGSLSTSSDFWHYDLDIVASGSILDITFTEQGFQSLYTYGITDSPIVEYIPPTVPEPSILALLGLGLTVMFGVSRRKVQS